MRYSSFPSVAMLILMLSSPFGSACALNECDGVFTDTPCSQYKPKEPVKIPEPARTSKSARKVLSEAELKEQARARFEHRQKRIWVGEVTKVRLKAEREHGVRINSTAIEQYCLDRATPLADCKTELDDVKGRIDDAIRLELEKRRVEAAEKSNESKDGSSQVIVVNPRPDFIVLRPRRRGRGFTTQRRPNSAGSNNVPSANSATPQKKTYTLSDQLQNR